MGDVGSQFCGFVLAVLGVVAGAVRAGRALGPAGADAAVRRAVRRGVHAAAPGRVPATGSPSRIAATSTSSRTGRHGRRRRSRWSHWGFAPGARCAARCSCRHRPGQAARRRCWCCRRSCSGWPTSPGARIAPASGDGRSGRHRTAMVVLPSAGNSTMPQRPLDRARCCCSRQDPPRLSNSPTRPSIWSTRAPTLSTGCSRPHPACRTGARTGSATSRSGRARAIRSACPPTATAPTTSGSCMPTAAAKNDAASTPATWTTSAFPAGRPGPARAERPADDPTFVLVNRSRAPVNELYLSITERRVLGSGPARRRYGASRRHPRDPAAAGRVPL